MKTVDVDPDPGVVDAAAAGCSTPFGALRWLAPMVADIGTTKTRPDAINQSINQLIN